MPKTLDDGTKLYSRSEIGYRYGKGRKGKWLRKHAIKHTGVSGTGGLSVESEMAICRAYERYHVQSRKMAGIAYSNLIGDSGTAYEGRGWGQDGAHTQNGGNREGYADCFIGDGTKAAPTAGAWAADRALTRDGIKVGAYPTDYEVSGHSTWYPKECPGDYIRDNMHAELDPDRVTNQLAKEWDEMASKEEIQQVVRDELHRALNTNANSVKIGDHQFPLANDIAGMAINAKAAKELAREARDAASR